MKPMTTTMTTTTINNNNTSEEICFGVWNPEEERILFGQKISAMIYLSYEFQFTSPVVSTSTPTSI